MYKKILCNIEFGSIIRIRNNEGFLSSSRSIIATISVSRGNEVEIKMVRDELYPEMYREFDYLSNLIQRNGVTYFIGKPVKIRYYTGTKNLTTFSLM